MVSPFGKRTLKVFLDLTLFWQGALIKKKCPVQPESTIAVSWCSISFGVRQSSKNSLVFEDIAAVHHSLLAWFYPMLSALVVSCL
jgi:hypothetical protein